MIGVGYANGKVAVQDRLRRHRNALCLELHDNLLVETVEIFGGHSVWRIAETDDVHRYRRQELQIEQLHQVKLENGVAPAIVFEVLSPSTALTDRRVKSLEYASVPGILVYVILETERPEVTVRRRATGWEAETIAGLDAELPLPEISVTIPLAAIYAR